MSFKDTLISLKIKAENLLSKDADEASKSLEELKGKSKDLRANLKLLEDQKTLIKQFQTQEKAVNKNRDAFKALSDRVYTLRKRIKETGDPTGQFAVQLEKTQTAAKKSSTAFKNQTTHLNKLKSSLKSTNVDTADLAKSEAKLTREITKSKTVLAGFAKSMKTVGKETKNVEKEAKSFSFVKAAYWTAGVTGVTALAVKVKSLAIEMLTTGDKFEGLRIQMDALMGSIEGGEQATEWIKEFTQKTPLQLEDVTKTFARLKAFGLDPMDGSMQAIVDQSEKLGGGMERVEGISLALGQAWAKQKLQGEEILQLVERGVPVWDLLEKATGRNALELQKLSREGKLGRDVIKQLTAEIGKGADGAAAANMGRMTGLISNLKDQWQLFLNEIAQSGALDYAKQQLTLLNKTIKEMANDGSLKKWAQDISKALVSFVEGLKDAGQWLNKFKNEIMTVGIAAASLKLSTIFIGFAASSVSAVKSLSLVRGMVIATTVVVKLLNNVLKTTLVGALLASAFQIYRVTDAFFDMRTAQEKAAESAKFQATQTEALAKTYKKYSDQVGINITSTEQWDKLLKDGIVIWDDTAKVYKKSNAELEKQTELQKHNAEVLANSLLPTVDRLKSKFEELQREGKSATDAIVELSASMDIEEPESIQTVVDTLKKLKDQGQITAKEIETGLRLQLKNLTDKELATLKKNAPDTFDAFGVSIKSVANEVDPLRDHFTKLGLDLNKLRGGFTETGKEALTAFKAIAESANASADEIVMAFDAAFDKVSTKSELDDLRKSVVELGKDGKVSSVQLGTLLENIADKTAKVTGEIKDQSTAIDSQNKAINDQNKELDENRDKWVNRVAISQSIVDAAVAERNATKDTSDAVQEGGDIIVNVSGRAQDASVSMAGAFMAVADQADLTQLSIGELSDKIEELEGRIYQNRQVHSEWFSEIARDQIVLDQQTMAIASQTKKLRELEQAFGATENPTLAMINNTENAIGSLSRLDDSQLSSLNNQLDSARQKLQSLQASAESALNSVRDEVDRINGNQADIEKRSYEAKLEALNNQLRDANLYQDTQAINDLKEAIKLTAQLHEQTMADIKEEAALKVEQETKSVSTDKETAITTEPSSKTVTVKLELGNNTANIPTTQQGSDDLLRLLQQNQRVTA